LQAKLHTWFLQVNIHSTVRNWYSHHRNPRRTPNFFSICHLLYLQKSPLKELSF
jgi:hypothetical protein